MQNRTNPMRRHSRFPVSWPLLYGNEAFVAEGTVLDLTALGWRVAGSIPVVPGMELTLQVSVPERSTPLCVRRATVLWVHDHEFAIEAREMATMDQAWVTEFLRQKLGLMWMSRTTDRKTPLQTGDEAPRGETTRPQPSVPSMDEILDRFLAIETSATAHFAEPSWNHDTDCHGDVCHTIHNGVPEKTLHEARRLLCGMVAIKTTCERTGRDRIADN
jgi:hypothetical protein